MVDSAPKKRRIQSYADDAQFASLHLESIFLLGVWATTTAQLDCLVNNTRAMPFSHFISLLFIQSSRMIRANNDINNSHNNKHHQKEPNVWHKNVFARRHE